MFGDLPRAMALTDEQEAAACHDGGNLLIVAGAGTGKTTTLTARLAHLVATGVAPERILLLTFTRRAAAELLGRVDAITGTDVAGRATGGTFHSVAARTLRRYGAAVGLDPGFTVLDQPDTADLLALVRDEIDEPGRDARRRARPDAMAAILSRVVNAREPLGDVLARRFPWCAAERDELAATFRAYAERKRAANVVDYDDLLLLWWAAATDATAGPLLAGRFDHVLVDEYQDTNALQADLLAALVDGGATITAVGDDAQAIYAFRAATVRNILDFPARFAADVVTLTRNHRSLAPVLAVADAVMAEATERHPKALVSVRGSGSRPTLASCHDEHAQAVAVCQRVLDHVDQGTSLRDQAVLFRTAHHSDLLEVELTVRHIPFVKYGGLKYLEAAHVKDLVATLRVLVNPADELAWFRVAQLLDGVGPATARRVAAAGGIEPALAVRALPDAALPSASALVEALTAARGAALAEQPAAQIETVRRWLDDRVVARRRTPAARLVDLERLQQAATATASLERFLTELTLDPPAWTGDLAGPPHLDDDFLNLSTIHSAKGCEWEVVHVIHLSDGNVPSDMAAGDAEEIEEERRLLYVAMTRARDALHCYAPLRYHRYRHVRNDLHGYALLSRFLSPAVRAGFDEVDVARPEPDADADGTLAATAGTVPATARIDALVSGLLG
jgi:DNA helicase-2/ATP-dependent DNA helicase PcrA